MQSVREGEAGTGRGRRIQWDGEKVSDYAAACRPSASCLGRSGLCLEYSFSVSLAPRSRWAKPMMIKIRIMNLLREFRHNPFLMTEFMLEKLQLHFYSVDAV